MRRFHARSLCVLLIAMTLIHPAAIGETNGLRSFRLRAVGDLMCPQPMLDQAKGEDSYNFMPCFDLVSPLLADADVTCGNLETTIGQYKQRDYSGYPTFNSPDTYLDAIYYSGVDVLTLANNHMLDRYSTGLITTADNVDAAGFVRCGSFRSQEERDTRVSILDVNGVRLGFLGYTDLTNGMENHCDRSIVKYAVPYTKKADYAADVRRLREAGAEVVIAFPHWGVEYEQSVHSSQRETAKKLANAGVDIILGSHPHVVQKVERVTTSDGREVFIAWSLGNFISEMRHNHADWGIILDLTVTEQPEGGFRVTKAGFIPVYNWYEDGRIVAVPVALYGDEVRDMMGDRARSRMDATIGEAIDMLQTEDMILLEK